MYRICYRIFCRLVNSKVFGSFSLQQGAVLQILVGQSGIAGYGGGTSSGGEQSGGTGGGGTFVIAEDSPLLIAGGGGGAYSGADDLGGGDGQITSSSILSTYNSGGNPMGTITNAIVKASASKFSISFISKYDSLKILRICFSIFFSLFFALLILFWKVLSVNFSYSWR